jgi:hypothetical protein
MSGCPLAEFLTLPANTKLYARLWLRDGAIHPAAHWIIRDRLRGWAQRVASAPVEIRDALALEAAASGAPRPTLTMPTGAAQSPAGERKQPSRHPVPLRRPRILRFAPKPLKRRVNLSPHPGVPGVPTIAERSLAAQAVGHRSVGWPGELLRELRDLPVWLVLSIVIAQRSSAEGVEEKMRCRETLPTKCRS